MLHILTSISHVSNRIGTCDSFGYKTIPNLIYTRNMYINIAQFLGADDGGGMTPDKMRQCMSLGYSAKSKLANTIGQCKPFFFFSFKLLLANNLFMYNT